MQQQRQRQQRLRHRGELQLRRGKHNRQHSEEEEEEEQEEDLEEELEHEQLEYVDASEVAVADHTLTASSAPPGKLITSSAAAVAG